MLINNVQNFFHQQYGFSHWRDSDTAIRRLKCNKENFFFHLVPSLEESEFYRDTPIFACKFSPQECNEHLVALANEEGKLAIHDSNSNTRHGIQAHNNAIFDLAWMFDQMKLVTASGDHTTKLYSIDGCDIREERVFCGHTRSVKTVAFKKDDSSVFASGGRDGNIILWDTRTTIGNYVGKADRRIYNSHSVKSYTPAKRKKFGPPPTTGIKSVTGLVFQDGNTLISCGAGDGIIKIWDLRKNYVTYKKEAMPKNLIQYPGNTTKNGYSNLVIDEQGVKLYANCLDNIIYCYNIGAYNTEPIMKYAGHQNNTFYVKSSLSKNGNYLISGSSDDNAYIWNTKYSHPIVKLTGHMAEVTCVAWCNKNNSLITCSDDMTHKIWTIETDQLCKDSESHFRSFAEILPIEKEPIRAKLKRTLLVDDGENDMTPKKLSMECERCNIATTSDRFCDSCTTNSKRKNSSELTNENKRILTDFGPKRLFSSINSVPEDTENLAASLDSKYDHIDTTKLSSDKLEPLVKVPRLNSPARNQNDDTLFSPTVNLPNYIVDGTAPHLNYSPPKKKAQDWLTKIRIERDLRKEMRDRTVGPSSPKISRLDTPTKSKRPSSPRSPLLRFFRVTNSTSKCDGLGCSKPHGCTGLVSNLKRPSQ